MVSKFIWTKSLHFDHDSCSKGSHMRASVRVNFTLTSQQHLVLTCKSKKRKQLCYPHWYHQHVTWWNWILYYKQNMMPCMRFFHQCLKRLNQILSRKVTETSQSEGPNTSGSTGLLREQGSDSWFLDLGWKIRIIKIT